MSRLNNTKQPKVYWWYDRKFSKYYVASFVLMGQLTESVEIDRFEDIEQVVANTGWDKLMLDYYNALQGTDHY